MGGSVRTGMRQVKGLGVLSYVGAGAAGLFWRAERAVSIFHFAVALGCSVLF